MYYTCSTWQPQQVHTALVWVYVCVCLSFITCFGFKLLTCNLLCVLLRAEFVLCGSTFDKTWKPDLMVFSGAWHSCGHLCKFYGLYHLKVETCIFLVLSCFGLSVCLNYMLWWCYIHLRYEYTPNPTLLLWHGLTNQCFDECREKRLNIISHISSNTCMDNQWTMSPLENGTSRYFTNRTVMQSSPLRFSHYQPRLLHWVVGNITCTVIILPSSSLSSPQW